MTDLTLKPAPDLPRRVWLSLSTNDYLTVCVYPPEDSAGVLRMLAYAHEKVTEYSIDFDRDKAAPTPVLWCKSAAFDLTVEEAEQVARAFAIRDRATTAELDDVPL